MWIQRRKQSITDGFTKPSTAGFTLIETLVVVSVIGVLGAIAAPSWQGFLEIQRLNTSQQQIYRGMHEALSNTKRDKLTWEFGVQEINGVVHWAVYPATMLPANAHWKALDRNVRLDDETTLRQARGVRRVQFNYKGNVNGQLGRVTLSSRSGGVAKRCVIVSTLIGTLRSAKEKSRADSEGRYCY